MRVIALLVVVAASASCAAGIGAKCSENNDCASRNCDAFTQTCVLNDCDDGRPCAAGLTCRIDDEHGNTCEQPLGRDEACDEESGTPPGGFRQGCATGLACVQDPREVVAGNGRCLPPANRTNGEFCTASSDCAAGLACDASTATCS
jgi:hypothetical protein